MQEIAQANKSSENRRTELELLKEQLEQTQLELQNQTVIIESSQKSEETVQQLNSEIEARRDKEVELVSQCKELESDKVELIKCLEELKEEVEVERNELKRNFETELQQLNEKLELESERCRTSVFEREQAKAELSSMQGLVENETASLRFQVSSQAIDLQRTREVCIQCGYDTF